MIVFTDSDDEFCALKLWFETYLRKVNASRKLLLYYRVLIKKRSKAEIYYSPAVEPQLIFRAKYYIIMRNVKNLWRNPQF